MDTRHAVALLAEAVDRPTRSATTLGQRGLPTTAAQGALGVSAVIAATLLGQALLGGAPDRAIDGLGAFLEIGALLLPLLLLAAFLQVGVPLRGLFGALAVAALHAGLVCLCLLPLVAFVAVVADMAAVHANSALVHAAIVGLVLPFAALQTLLGRLATTIRTLDRRLTARLLCGLGHRALILLFFVRAFGPSF